MRIPQGGYPSISNPFPVSPYFPSSPALPRLFFPQTVKLRELKDLTGRRTSSVGTMDRRYGGRWPLSGTFSHCGAIAFFSSCCSSFVVFRLKTWVQHVVELIVYPARSTWWGRACEVSSRPMKVGLFGSGTAQKMEGEWG